MRQSNLFSASLKTRRKEYQLSSQFNLRTRSLYLYVKSPTTSFLLEFMRSSCCKVRNTSWVRKLRFPAFSATAHSCLPDLLKSSASSWISFFIDKLVSIAFCMASPCSRIRVISSSISATVLPWLSVCMAGTSNEEHFRTNKTNFSWSLKQAQALYFRHKHTYGPRMECVCLL